MGDNTKEQSGSRRQTSRIDTSSLAVASHPRASGLTHTNTSAPYKRILKYKRGKLLARQCSMATIPSASLALAERSLEPQSHHT